MPKKSVPRHIAIIMDGNGRWAQKRGFQRLKGHEEGIQSIERVLDGCNELGIDYVTLYAFSTENWNRPKHEISFLMELLSRYLDDKLDTLIEKDIRFNAIGRLHQLDKAIQDKINRNIEKTKNNKKTCMTLALSYSGRAELIDAIQAITHDAIEGRITSDSITEETVGRYLYDPNLPEPDLLIRTSGEMRVSNFLLWQISYTELFVTDTLWPDFSKKDLIEAVNEYKKRERRYGRI